jgi:hypothetical protein
MSPPLSPEATDSAHTRIVPPRWARAVDIVCLLLLVLAVIVAEWGGFRERIAGIRIALTSPYRLMIIAAVLTAVRHAIAPRPPIYADLSTRALAWLRAPAARAAWSPFIGTRPAILFVGYMAVVMLGYNHGRPPLRLSENEVANLQVRWDMAWYFGIATEGYRVISHDPTAQQNIVFFPAFPMLMRAAGRLLGGATMAFVVGGTLVALGGFFWALTYLFRLARDLTGDDDPARYAVWLLAAYPFALFYGAVYTESLYLLGAVAAFFHFRRREWWAAGAWGLLVGLTRPNGCFLSIPLAVMAAAPWLPSWVGGQGTGIGEQGSGTRGEQAQTREDRRPLRRLVPALAAAAMPGIGVLLYSAFVWRIAGDPLAWAEGHAAWGREYQGLSTLISDRYSWLANEGVYAYTSQVPGDLLNGLGALFVLLATVPVARRFGLAYALFILVNILPPMAAGGMLSVGRFSSVLFPAFIWFAAVIPVRHRTGWLASFMAVQAFNAALFYTWHELF